MRLNNILPLVAVVALALGGVVLWLQPERAPVSPRESATQAADPGRAPEAAPAAPLAEQFLILAASWQPAFCETQPRRPECRSMTEDRYDASHFALHGLWPRDEYCGVPAALVERDRASRWADLPALELAPGLAARLAEAMPGARSGLDRHEWIKHGTCLGGTVTDYYEISLAFMAALNDSAVRDLFADNVGRRLERSAIRAAFDRAFGPGAGERVRISCVDDGGRELIDEITIGLWGVPAADADFAALIQAARPTGGGCDGGIVDPVGLQ